MLVTHARHERSGELTIVTNRPMIVLQDTLQPGSTAATHGEVQIPSAHDSCVYHTDSALDRRPARLLDSAEHRTCLARAAASCAFSDSHRSLQAPKRAR
jgi:hypothetical protein